MYERMTDRARKTMQWANQEAQRLCHEYIGTEHLIIALAKDPVSVAGAALGKFGASYHALCSSVDKLVKRGPDMCTMGKLPMTPRVKRVIEMAMEAARDLNHNYVGTEHLLLGFLRMKEGEGYKALTAINDADVIQGEVMRLLGQQGIFDPTFWSVGISGSSQIEIKVNVPVLSVKAARKLAVSLLKFAEQIEDHQDGN